MNKFNVNDEVYFYRNGKGVTGWIVSVSGKTALVQDLFENVQYRVRLELLVNTSNSY
jgi:hypothetical protein